MTFNLTALRKFVVYQIQMLAYTAAGDGVLSSPAVSVRTFEDGTQHWLCLVMMSTYGVMNVPAVKAGWASMGWSRAVFWPVIVEEFFWFCIFNGNCSLKQVFTMHLCWFISALRVLALTKTASHFNIPFVCDIAGIVQKMAKQIVTILSVVASYIIVVFYESVSVRNSAENTLTWISNAAWIWKLHYFQSVIRCISEVTMTLTNYLSLWQWQQWCVCVRYCTVPGPPSSVYFPEVTETTARIVWSEPREANGVITGYRVTYGLRSSLWSTVSNNSLSALHRDYHVTRLASYRHYVFTVASRTRSGWGDNVSLAVYTIAHRSESALLITCYTVSKFWDTV